MYSLIEKSIIARLSDRIDGVRLEAYPDQPKELGKPTPSARILIGYQGSSFTSLSEDPRNFSMEETLTYELTFEVKGLRTHRGAYPLLDVAKNALMGYVPAIGQFRPVRPKAIAFKGVTEGIWYYSMTISLSVVIPQTLTELTDPGATIPANFVIEAGLWRSKVDRLLTETILDTEFNLYEGDG